MKKFLNDFIQTIIIVLAAIIFYLVIIIYGIIDWGYNYFKKSDYE